MKSISTHERAVIEFLGLGPKNPQDITNYFQWPQQLITNCLNMLIKEKYIYFKDNKYFVNSEKTNENENEKENIKYEVLELVEKMTATFFNSKLKNKKIKVKTNDQGAPCIMLKKFFINKSDFLILQSMLIQINELLERSQKNNNQLAQKSTFNEQFVFYSVLTNYQEALNQSN